jgi:Mrp family chromosome partitioning ATPase
MAIEARPAPAPRGSLSQRLSTLRGRAPGAMPAPPAPMLEACRVASLQIGGPTLASLGVTSAVRGEGRSWVAHALARVQEEDYQRRVALLDLDLEMPALARRLGASPSPGLAELAEGSAALEDVLQPLSPRVTLIAAGAGCRPPARTMSDLLRSDALAAIAERFDVVIADLPPLLGGSLGQAPTAAVAGLLLVVRSGVTPLGRVREATAHLPVPPTVLLNGTRSSLPPWLRRLTGA